MIPLVPRARSLQAIRTKAVAIFATAALVAVGALGILVVDAARQAAGTRAREAFNTLHALDGLRVVLVDAETGQRGYLLTGNPSYLEPYEQAIDQVSTRIDEVQRTLGARAPEGTLRRLRALAAAKRSELSQTIVLQRAGDEAGVRRLFETHLGLRTMHELREELAGLERTELATLAAWEGQRPWWVSATRGTVLLTGLLVFGLLAWLGAGVQRDVEKLDAQRRTIDQQTGEIEARAEALAAELGRADALSDELRRANDALRRGVAARGRIVHDLERRNRELDQFAYVASHDLKAPLRGIASLATWLEEDLGNEVPPSVVEHLGLLRGRVVRMEGLIDGILQYSRAGRATGTVAPVSLGEVVEDVREMLGRSGDELRVEGELPTMIADRVQLQQVVLNLASNAFKHGGTHVTVRARQLDGEHEIAVIDDGPGIAPRFQTRIFEIFQTLAPRDTLESTGIGLAVVRKIVDAAGGRVWVVSDEGEGAAFLFTWPIEPGVAVDD